MKLRCFFAVIAVVASAGAASAYCPMAVGYMMFKAAWPTEIYNSCEYERIEPKADGSTSYLIKVYGMSRPSDLDDIDLNDGYIWFRTDINVRDGHPITYEHLDHHFETPPGTLVDILTDPDFQRGFQTAAK
ncbi:hypothetical protein [Paracoccus sp. (in: a-proteobacteria)]|uniref:hypothetical protein n=1 Tax=Paracoccus sp. TaxID=267 RepID=UPI0026DEC8D5|nr:hypothetical protein [Paracoccus sp. (in: a-proteobacteria)]MDO5647621.1 hypothetical protein [Paracoccus sp. (in: a-proteobacteria)]